MKRRWTIEDKKLLAAVYPCSHYKALERLFGSNRSAISSMCVLMRLSKSKFYYQGPFGPKIREPVNKILAREKYSKYDRLGFGKVKVVSGYLVVEYENGKMRNLSRMVWEKHHGKPLPENHIIVQLDGDRMNVDPENLKAVTRTEIMNKNSFSQLPNEIRNAHKLNKKIMRLINEQS